MSKIELDPIVSGYNLETVNANFQKIEDEFNQKVLYRANPAGNPNQMLNNIDMNGKNILNVGAITGGSGTPGNTADNITFTPGSGVTSTNVQDAIVEVQSHISSTAAGVASYNGRTGVVVGTSGDVTDALGYAPAPINNPILTGDVIVPTVAAIDNSNKAASTAFVKSNTVNSFNTRKGDVTLSSADVTLALGYTPSSTSGTSSVSNIVALKALTSSTQTSMTTRGYYTQGDGGASTYYMDLTDTTSTDNGGSVIVATDGGRWKFAKSGVFNARQFGAKGDGTTDDTTAIQNLVNYLALTGTRGHIPWGKYRVTNRITFTNTVYLYGDGWKDIRDMVPSISPTARDWAQAQIVGTIIYADYTSAVNDSVFYINGNSVTIKDMEFEAKQPLPGTGWVSNSTPYAINLFRERFYEQGGNNVLLDNIMLRNFQNGIHANGVSTGTIRNISGQCFGVGIYATRNYGVLRIEDVNLGGSFYSGNADVVTYMNAHAIGISLGRTDNPILSNIFTFGGQIGLQLFTDTSTSEGGKTERLQANNLGFDDCYYGMDLQDSVTADISNFYVYCRADAGSRGIHSRPILGGGQIPIRLSLSNGDFAGSMTEAGRFEVPGEINFTNIRIRNYNNSVGGFPGIAVYDSVNLRYKNLISETSNVAPVTFANGTGTITGDSTGGGGGLTSFMGRTTAAAVLTVADINSALTSGAAIVNNPATIRATNATNPTSGAGLELSYVPSGPSSYISSFDRTANTYKDLQIGGRAITFTNNIGNVGAWDASGNLTITTAPTSGDNSNKVPTTSWVRTYVSGISSGVSSFNTRTGAVTLSFGDITGALGYTPVNPSANVSAFNSRTGSVSLLFTDVTGALGYSPVSSNNPNFTGFLSSFGTMRSSDTTNPAGGVGVEVNYDTSAGAGFVNAFDRSGSVYKPLNFGGTTINFKTGTSGVNAAFFDTNQSLLIGYGSTNGSSYKLQVNSQIFATSATIATSDVRVKEDIENVTDATSQVLALRPVTYKFKKHPIHNFPKGIQIGFIAQEVEQALDGSIYTDSIVHTLDDGHENLKGLAEAKIVPLLVATIKELEARIKALENK